MNALRWKPKLGFTIVEVIIVIAVIGMLAGIVVVSYNGTQKRAREASREADMELLLQAIIVARTEQDKTLLEITGSGWSLGACIQEGDNSANIEPRDLPKSHPCWQRYYSNLAAIGDAAGMNLSGLRSGDERGNPYMFDENEGENGDFCQLDSNLVYFAGRGAEHWYEGPTIPKYLTAPEYQPGGAEC